jgi:hypothetical protein
MKTSPSVWSFGKAKKNELERNSRFKHLDQECILIVSTIRTNLLYGSKLLICIIHMIISRIGTAERSQMNNSKISVPGVGQYSLDRSFNKGPKYTMRPKTKDIYPTSDSPGPGNYTPNYNIEHKSTEKYTMRPKTGEIKSYKQVPGPGQYQIRNDKADLKQPSFVFGTEKKNKLPNTTNIYNPGPGAYGIDNDVPSKTNAPMFSFGKEDRATSAAPGGRERAKTPGPGQYSSNAKVLGTGGPKISMSFSRPTTSIYKSDTPGPGQYTSSMNNMNKPPGVK